MWDERYSGPGYAYGTEPNDFLRDVAGMITGSDVLSLAEGEGRNAVYLAGLGFNVVGVDSSAVGLAKARALAEERSLSIETIEADLAAFHPGSSRYDAVVSIFCHLPESVLTRLYAETVEALRPGGILILEAYGPRQLEYGTGGPRTLELLHDRPTFERMLTGLEFEISRDVVRSIEEGEFHSGESAVVQIVGRKP